MRTQSALAKSLLSLSGRLRIPISCEAEHLCESECVHRYNSKRITHIWPFLLDGSVIDGLEFSVVTITILSGSAKAYEIKNGSRPIFSI